MAQDPIQVRDKIMSRRKDKSMSDIVGGTLEKLAEAALDQMSDQALQLRARSLDIREREVAAKEQEVLKNAASIADVVAKSAQAAKTEMADAIKMLCEKMESEREEEDDGPDLEAMMSGFCSSIEKLAKAIIDSNVKLEKASKENTNKIIAALQAPRDVTIRRDSAGDMSGARAESSKVMN